MSTAPIPPTLDAPTTVRRVRSADRFTPRPKTEGATSKETIVARNIFGERASTTSQLSRERVVAGDLPEWEPLPPGELQVVRHR